MPAPADRVPLVYGPVGPDDDVHVRRLMRDIASGGDVSLAIEKEPSAEAALEVEGEVGVFVVGRRSDDGHIVGGGSRSVKRCFVDGDVVPVGYLGALRIEPAWRGGRSLQGGYEAMGNLHRTEQDARLYLTTIVEGNRPAIRALTSQKGFIPPYRDRGRYHTRVFGTRHNPWRRHLGDADVTSCDDVEALVDFWHREGPARQFFPYYTADHLRSPTGLLRGLSPDDVLVARDRDQIVGTLAIWDQSPFRQWVVRGYSPRIRRIRPLYNLVSPWLGGPTLPSAGHPMDYRFLSMPVAPPDVFRALLAHAFERTRGPALVAGLHERDPLDAVLAEGRGFTFASRLFVVHWPEDADAYEALGDRVPYAEVGSL